MSVNVVVCLRQSRTKARSPTTGINGAHTAHWWHKNTVNQSHVNLSDSRICLVLSFLLLLFLVHNFVLGITFFETVDRLHVWGSGIFFYFIKLKRVNFVLLFNKRKRVAFWWNSPEQLEDDWLLCLAPL